MTRAPLVAVVLLWPVVASAATIDFAHPTIAATRFCSSGPTPIGFGFLDLVEHQGLRVDFSNEMGAQNRYACDNDAPVFPTDWPSPTTPFRELVLPDGELRLMTIWAADNGFFQVSNIGGASI